MASNKFKIPDDLKSNIKKTAWRKEVLAKCGKKAFLMPEKLSYPIMDENCNYRLCLLHAAYSRLNEFHKHTLANKVKTMIDKLEKQGKSKSPKLESTDTTYEDEYQILFGTN